MGEAQGTRGDDSRTREGVGCAERGDAQAGLGQAGSAEGDGAREDEVTVAAQRQGIVSRGNRPAERERTGVAAEKGGTIHDNGSAQGVVPREIAQDTRAEAAARQREGFVAGDTTEDAQGGAGGDHGRARGAAEAGRTAEVERARVDIGHAAVI